MLKRQVMRKECHTGEFIPYTCHYDSETIFTKAGWLLKTIKLNGFAFETADDEDVDIQKSLRNQLFKSIASGNFALYFHTFRMTQTKDAHDFFSGRMTSIFGEYVNQTWRKKYEKGTSFKNELYITVVRKFDTKGVAILNHLLNKIKRSSSKDAMKSEMKAASEELNETVNKMVSGLRVYDPKILGTIYTPKGCFSEILGFFRKIVNCLQDNYDPIVPVGNIAEYIPSVRLYFGYKQIEIVKQDAINYAGIISLKEYGQYTSAGMLDNFLHIPYELIITQTFQFTNRQVAINKMQIQQNRMIQSQDKAISQIAEINRALDDAMSGRIGFGEHHLTILCMAKTPKGLESAASLIDSELSNTGVYSVREKVNMEPAFWAQLPCNFDYIVRKAIISTLNLASFASNHNYPSGTPVGNFWGKAVTVFDTVSGTPFFFNFHVRDVGHTMIIGPTGAGKTVLMNFLCAQAVKFKPRIFFFDKDRGAEIFIRAIGGIYTIIEPRTESNFNPLQIENTADNCTFLTEWLKQLVSVNGEKISAEDTLAIAAAVDGNFKLRKEDRRLSNLVPFLGMEGPDTLAGRIAMWHTNGSHAKIFDNPTDELDLTRSSFFGFEMGQLLKDKASLGPVLTYLFHRINISLDGSPTMIVLDEAWALIDNPVFGPTIKDWLKVLRKLNTFVIFATQSVEDASKSAISDTLVQQTATQIFLPNLKATETYKSVFMLSQREYTLIKSTDPATRFFLIKQTISAVIARINLKNMDDIISVLSGRAETVLLLDRIIEEVGSSDPKDWLDIFYDRVKNL
ncbi:VirB4 family type IV secretion/conjugal transfer ATPase [Anaplasmataceae bacterium AB001_6]|nr:VirB4 family type IV secretion/conjugal transfer ATPase [Anaplasmataceae bacterium AB001_6]